MPKGVAPKYIFGRLNPAYRPNASKAAVAAEKKRISARGRKKGYKQTTANIDATYRRNASRLGAKAPVRKATKQTKVLSVPAAYQPGASQATINAELKKISAAGKAKGYKQTTANIVATYKRNMVRMAARAKANKALTSKPKTKTTTKPANARTQAIRNDRAKVKAAGGRYTRSTSGLSKGAVAARKKAGVNERLVSLRNSKRSIPKPKVRVARKAPKRKSV